MRALILSQHDDGSPRASDRTPKATRSLNRPLRSCTDVPELTRSSFEAHQALCELREIPRKSIRTSGGTVERTIRTLYERQAGAVRHTRVTTGYRRVPAKRRTPL